MKKQKEKPSFVLGDIVTWFSSGTEKTGTVVLVVEKRTCPSYTFNKSGLEKEGFRFTSYGGGTPRNHETYLIALNRSPKGTTRKVYWPLVEWLKKVE